MDNEKNISLILKQPEDETSKHESVFTLPTLIANIKKYAFIWIIVSVIAVVTIFGTATVFKSTVADGEITALVSFNYNGIQSGLAPDGSKFNVNKIKSPSIIESALTENNLSLNYVEPIRRNIKIDGIIPDSAMDKITLYQNVYSNGGTSALAAVESLLEIGYHPTYYVVTLDYSSINLDMSECKLILDGILSNYQEYFFTKYGYNESLGSSVVMIDYTDYDYPAAIDIFNTILSDLDDYANQIESRDPDFRSAKTGYSFRDIGTTIDTIQVTDLDSLSAYITINNVVNDKSLLINYYEYKIEQLEREQNVHQAEFESVSTALTNYEKDTLLVFGEVAEGVDTTYTQASAKYDELIEQKISAQRLVSKCKQRIKYYKTRIDALDDATTPASEEDKKYVEEQLALINDKLTELIDTVNTTADEYYEKVTFAKAYNILVPATGLEPAVKATDILIPAIIVEVVLFMGYVVCVFISTIRTDYKKARNNKDTEESEDE